MKVDSRISVNDFLKECKEDISSPTTSTFTTKLSLCRSTIAALEESLDADRSSLKKLKNAAKAMCSSGQTHSTSETSFVENLEKLGNNEWNKSVAETDPDIGSAFLRLSCFMRSIFDLFNKLVRGMNENVMFPLESLLKGDLKGVKGDMKRPFDKSWKDYDTKVKHVEREKRQLAKEAGMIRGEISGSEIAEEMERERRMFQLQMCEYLIKANDIKTKKEVELLQNLVNFYECQNKYFSEGVKVIQQFRAYTDKLTSNLKALRQTHEEERKQLQEVRSLLRATFNDETTSNKASSPTVYNLHQMQGNRKLGNEKEGYLHKKSEGLRKTWQKRKCQVHDGYLYITHHNLSSKPPAKLNLLTSQLKLVAEDKKQFDLVSHNRTYRFMADTETEAENWVSVLQNSKLDALNQVFVGGGHREDNGGSGGGGGADSGLRDLTRAIIEEIKRMPGNDVCCDCNNQNPTWLSTNLGVLLCIECSGIHREMGVHVSRIQSITLDELGTSELLLARTIGNSMFNEIMEEQLYNSDKPTTASDMEERKSFIRGKYLERSYVVRTCGNNSHALSDDLAQAVRSCDLASLLQIFAEQANLAEPLAGYSKRETALHVASSMPISHRALTSVLPLVDFLTQNVGAAGLNMQTSDGDTALHICARTNNTECMKLLLRSKAKTDIDNKKGEKAVDVAMLCKHEACVELLKQANTSKFRVLHYIDIEWNLTYADDGDDFISDDELDDKNLPLQPAPQPAPYKGLDVAGQSSSMNKEQRSKSSDPAPSLPVQHRPTPNHPPPPVPAHGSRVRSQTANTNINFAPWSGMPTPAPTSSKRDEATPDKPIPGGRNAAKMGGGEMSAASKLERTPAISRKHDSLHPSDKPTTPEVKVKMRSSQQQLSASAATTTPHHHRMSGTGGGGTPTGMGRCRSLLDGSSSPSSASATSSDSRVKRLSARFGSQQQQQHENHHPQLVNNHPPLTRATSRPGSHHAPRNHRLYQAAQHQRQSSNPALLGSMSGNLPSVSSLSLSRNVQPPTTLATSTTATCDEPAHYKQPNKPALPPPRAKTPPPPPGRKVRRVRALYDCDADNDDELTFVEDEVIIVTGEEDSEWWIGHVEHQLHRTGVFPIKFVKPIVDNDK